MNIFSRKPKQKPDYTAMLQKLREVVEKFDKEELGKQKKISEDRKRALERIRRNKKRVADAEKEKKKKK